MAEPVEPEVEAVRLRYRKEFAAEIETRIRAAMEGGHLPEQDAALSAPAVVGALLEGLIGPLAPDAADDPARAREAVQALTLIALRGLGVVDARARGLVGSEMCIRDSVMRAAASADSGPGAASAARRTSSISCSETLAISAPTRSVLPGK